MAPPKRKKSSESEDEDSPLVKLSLTNSAKNLKADPSTITEELTDYGPT